MAFPAAQQLGSAQFDYGGNDDDSGLDAVGAHEVLDSTAAKTKKTGKRGTTAVPDLDAILEGEAANPLAGDYSYFDVSKLNTWAGPQHWKFKKTTSNLSSNKDKETSALEANEDQFGAVATEAASSKKRGKKTKGVFMIDFMAPINRKELEKRFEPAGKVSTTLSKISLQSQSRSASSLTLGPDEGYEASMLTKLFSKPQMTIPVCTELLPTTGPELT
jgi:condensin complex subunit 2